MDDTQLEKQFSKIGARVRVRIYRPAGPQDSQPGRLDIQADKKGEYFDIKIHPGFEPQVLDSRPDIRHLLLLLRGARNRRPFKAKYLCGHDERHWFIAAVPATHARDVATAFEALKPSALREDEAKKGLSSKARMKRRNASSKRQGEWFFLPATGVDLTGRSVLRHEPIRRGRSKPHICEELVRLGGETVWVYHTYPNGLTETEYRQLLSLQPGAAKWPWRIMARNAAVYVRGKITHPDHKTLILEDWHRVLLAEESRSVKPTQPTGVVFLD